MHSIELEKALDPCTHVCLKDVWKMLRCISDAGLELSFPGEVWPSAEVEPLVSFASSDALIMLVKCGQIKHWPLHPFIMALYFFFFGRFLKAELLAKQMEEIAFIGLPSSPLSENNSGVVPCSPLLHAAVLWLWVPVIWLPSEYFFLMFFRENTN